MRKCKICSVEFDLNELNFYRDKLSKSGFRSCCKRCETLKHKKRVYKEDIKRVDYINNLKLCDKCNLIKPLNDFRKLGFVLHKNKRNSSCKKCNYESEESKNEKIRKREIKANLKYLKYNITKEDYLKKVEIQNNCCKICGNNNHLNMRLFIDHDHKTGKVRDLLCHKCNAGLGFFNDNIELMKNAIDYINYHNM